MKKIMFNDKYGLTKAVLEGRKTMTRRIIKTPRIMEGKDVYGFSVVRYPRTGVPIEVMALDADGAQINNILPKYKVGEVVAVAQAYKDIPNPFYGRATDKSDAIGWGNKMFVKAELMPHQIRITNVRVEKLQDISDDACLWEGIYEVPFVSYAWEDNALTFDTPRDAFSTLIDKVSGNGTWDSNPWVFVYEFKLVK